MSKLIKRIRKENKHLDNCLVVGDAWGNIDSVVENFENIFLKKTDKIYPRVKNVIVKEYFSELSILPKISYAFLDKEYLDKPQDFEKVLTWFNPVIYIGSGEFLDKEKSKYFNSLGYEIVELRKDCQVWKIKGKR